MPRPPPSFEERRQRIRDYCRPGFLRQFLHSQGKPLIYLSDDGAELVTENADGTVERKPIENVYPPANAYAAGGPRRKR